MKFKSGTRRPAVEYEKDIAKRWKTEGIFEKSIEQRPSDNKFVFYDGPPFLTGTPHHGHLLVSTIKDTVARYKTMQGHRVERRWGWDCHGLPAEVFVENKLGIKNKKEIGTKISIADYVRECRSAMVQTGTEWEDTIDRLGRWVEFEGAYKTMDNEYMESVWWAFKNLHENGKIYEGEKILIYCTKDATPISKSEVAMENSYQLDTDPSVFVYIQIEDTDEYMLVWTTTPWTLPANVAVAINPELEYSLVEYGGKKFYVASEAVEKVMTNEKHQPLEYSVVKTVSGKTLVDKRYSPLFENRGPEAHHVLPADFVTATEGTGIVHQAPAYGEDDYELCKKHNIPIVSLVDENGHYTEGRWQGENIWEVNKEIAKTLLAEGAALKIEYVKHEYPHCHRCGTKLMYRAHPSWFLDIQSQKHEMLEQTKTTNWVPKNLRDGRFTHTIETAPDWNLSRDRYWATPIPVWRGVRNDGTELIKVIGSYDEFEELTGKRLDDYHLPNVMNVTFELDGVEMVHIGKVLDCWFESGSMPFAQFHYPFENKEKFDDNYPADFITESIDQTRGWFYAMMAVNVGLFGKTPFKNLICTGFINAADGRKMSKKLKNYTDPVELMDKYSADSFRFLIMSTPLASGENFNLNDREVGDTARKLGMIWNMYDFFTMYAEVDGWQWNGDLSDPSKDLSNPLDTWIISRVHQLVQEVQEGLEGYDIPEAVKPILPFIDDASNWYVRRSRRRFWKSGDDADKSDAYRTLHYVLVKLSQLLAPFTPFLAEELYGKLTDGGSVHLLDWPEVGVIDKTAIAKMATLRGIISQGLSQRSREGIKVRQPLAKVIVRNADVAFLSGKDSRAAFYLGILYEELNIKSHQLDTGEGEMSVELDLNITPELRREGLAREVVRLVQSARKQAGLNVDDRIVLSIKTNNKEMVEAVREHSQSIADETLAVHVVDGDDYEYSSKESVGDAQLTISLQKHML